MSRWRRPLLLIAIFAAVASFMALLLPKQAEAAGETYRWQDYRTIAVSGGDLKQGTGPGGDPYNRLILQAEEGGENSGQLSGDQIARFGGTLLVDKNGGCTVSVSVFLFRDSGNGGGRVWNPPPYGPVVGNPGSAPPCSDDIQASYHDVWVGVGGNRPGNSNAPERESEKRVTVSIAAPEPMSRAPNSVTITIKKNGQTIAQKTAPETDDSGQADYPPDQTPVYYRTDFSLDPGEYEVCATYVITNCEKFTKKKYEPLFLSYGDRFEMPHQRRITVKVEIHTTRPCDSTLRNGPVEVTLKKPNGDTVKKSTPEFVSNPSSSESGTICTVNVVMERSADFDDMSPGQYEACAAIADKCVTITKKKGEAAEGTIVISLNEFVAPEEEPVCNTGTGFAGFLAFVICPITSLMTDAADFIERNLIIPYLTVSPLQTEGAVYSIWQAIRNIANVAFIITFMIIIFSQATSIGISNYGIKRMLPRLFAVAIGANISFFIVAFAIDTFNVLGAGIADLVLAAIPNTGGGDNPGAGQNSIAALAAFGGLAVAAALTSAGAVLGWLWGLIATAFMIILIAVIVLVLRQMIIIILTILSPLAFVASLLPNTEKYFTKWRQLLIQLLLMYPMIVLLFATGKIFTALVNAGEFQLTSGGAPEQVAESIRVLFGFVAAVLPLAVLPFTFMASGTLMARIQTQAQKIGAKGREKAGAAVGSVARPLADKYASPYKLAQSNNRFLRGIGYLGTQKQRREFAAGERERELKDARSEYIAQRALEDERFRRSAAGIGTETGAQRVLAAAYASQERTRKEDLKNSTALLNQRLKDMNMDEKTFASTHLKDYLQNGADEVRNANGEVIFRFSDNQRLMPAMLHNAAALGEVNTIEEARLSSQASQKDVDQAIEDNSGAMKGSGGYHLATDFTLANGRNLPADPNAARLALEQARLKQNWAGTPAKDIAGNQWGFIESVKDSLQDPSHRAQVLGGLNAQEREKVKANIEQILNTQSISANANNLDAIKEIHSHL